MLKRWREWLKNLTKSLLFLAVPVIVTLLFLALWKVPQWQVQSYRARFDPADISKLDPDKRLQLEKDLITAETNARVALAQILGGLALLSGLYLTWRNVRVAEEGKLTDRFSKAVELLGSKELDVRLGGIYALERIARDSPKDHWTVMEVLTAYVREHAKHKPASSETASDGVVVTVDPWSELEAALPLQQAAVWSSISIFEKPQKATDIQAILTVIGRRKWTAQERRHQRLNLSGIDLSGTDLGGADLSWADLSGTNLNGANLNEANLQFTDFCRADLSGANLESADLSGASLIKSNLSKAALFKANLSRTLLILANLYEAELRWVTLSGASLNTANLRRVDLSLVKKLTWQQVREAIIDDTTKLPPEIENQHKDELNTLREKTKKMREAKE